MTLDQYLTDAKITDAAFAVLIDRDPATVSRLKRGLTKPDWITLDRIREATGGLVMPNDFLPADENASAEDAA